MQRRLAGGLRGDAPRRSMRTTLPGRARSPSRPATGSTRRALNDAWDESYGVHAAPGGDEHPARPRRGPPRQVLLLHATHWVTDNVGRVIAVAPGSFQCELGCPGDWQPDCLRSWLQDPDGDGTYALETTVDCPPAQLRGQGRDQRVLGRQLRRRAASRTARTSRSRSRHNAKVDVQLRLGSTHVLTIRREPRPGHDNNVEWDGLRHDSRDTLYRTPGRRGAGGHAGDAPVPHVPRRRHGRDSARCTASTTAGRAPADDDRRHRRRLLPGRPRRQVAATSGRSTLPQRRPDNLWYRFLVTDGTDTDYYADDTAALDGGLGETERRRRRPAAGR